jgi:hypothetical protein
MSSINRWARPKKVLSETRISKTKNSHGHFFREEQNRTYGKFQREDNETMLVDFKLYTNMKI